MGNPGICLNYMPIESGGQAIPWYARGFRAREVSAKASQRMGQFPQRQLPYDQDSDQDGMAHAPLASTP